ncbi:MAG: S8 family serine peptidase [Nanoarchaeota archaeon]|nr:S8 family serine peptidase [Nanoarchaeota archaeon]
MNQAKTKLGLIFALFVIAIFISGIVIAQNNSERTNFVSDEVIIKLKEDKSIDSLNLDKAKVKKIARGKNKHFKDKGLDRLYLLKVGNAEKAIKNLKNNPNVEYVEPNYIVTITLIPNDPDFSKLYGLHNTGQTGGTADADIDAPEAWDIQTGSDAVVVAVIDTGVDYNHEDLAANMWVNVNEIPDNNIDDDNNGFIDDYLGWDFYNDDNDPFDDQGHGTHVSGTIGAVGNNGIGVVGVSWNVRVMPLKFLSASGSGSTADAIAAIEYATSMNANIMSNSWGGGGFSQALKDAISAANAAGILFVAAAGNNGEDTDSSPHYPSSYDVPNVVSVAATDDNDNLASFSNFGATSVDLGAPGVSIFSTVPTGSCSLCDASGYRYLSGTSMATPHVSGAAALIKSQFPEITHLDIKTLLLSSVDHLTSLESKTVSEGRLNAFNSLEDDTIAPGAITDLTPVDKTFQSVTLTWTATGDDDSVGTASSYDLRYSTLLIDATNFDSATEVSNLPKPQASGSTEVFEVNSLDSSTTYYFAIKAIDNVGNKGAISNIASETTTEPTVLFSDDFESGVNGWTLGGSKGKRRLWELGMPTSGPGSAFSGLNVWATNLDGNYNKDRVKEYLISPTIDLTLIDNAALAFQNWYDTERSFDGGVIEISIDNGINWEYVLYEGYDTTLGCNNPLPNDWEAFSGKSDGWRKEAIDLTPYTGNVVKLRFTFASDCSVNNYPGWYIDDFAILVEPAEPNNPPVADANGPYEGTEDIDVVFNGSGSSDPDGDALTYNWDFGDGSTGTGVNPSHAYTAGGTYTVTLIVNDGKVDSEPSTTTATITEVNDAPVADAGPDQTVTDSDDDGVEDVILDGSGSSDPDGSIVSYEWTEGATLLGTGATLTTSFTVAGSPHTVTLTVTDNGGATDSDEVVITVNEASATPALHVADITMSIKKKGSKFDATALVTVVDQDGILISTATVTGDWSGAVTITGQTADTNGDGTAKFRSGRNGAGTYTFTVTNINKDGYVYDAVANVETSDSISSP